MFIHSMHQQLTLVEQKKEEESVLQEIRDAQSYETAKGWRDLLKVLREGPKL